MEYKDLIEMLKLIKAGIAAQPNNTINETVVSGIKPNSIEFVINKTIEELEALDLVIDWATECDFGLDNIVEKETCERYPELFGPNGWSQKECLIYLAKKELENVKREK